jgi:predicted NUDIX family NTP pyrophosphohydrolase
VLLVHPGGPFWANKDEAGWSIPKGEADPGEDLEAAARREFAEEVGAVPSGDLLPLGQFKQSSKIVAAFALEGAFDPAALVSNTIEIDWPPHSGKKLSIPEVDRAQWFSLDDARLKLHLGQRPIIEALAKLVPTGVKRQSSPLKPEFGTIPSPSHLAGSASN